MNKNFDIYLKKYYTARIDIKNYGTNNNVEILIISDSNSEISRPDWFNDHFGEGVQIHSFKGDLDLKIKCINQGELKINLRGIDVRDKKGNRFPVYIDYTKFSVNNEEIINGNELTWHDQPYRFSKLVSNSEIVDINVQWMPFSSSSEFKVDDSSNLIQDLSRKLSMRESQLKSIPQLSGTTLGYTVLDGRLTYRNYIGNHENSVLDDFNGYCDNVWFTRYLKHKFPNEDFKINIFGVYNPHNNLAYPMEGKKVLYSLEELNNVFLELKYNFDKYALDYVDLAMSYERFDHPKYFRFPYWILHFSPESTEEDIEKKIDYWNSVNHEKSKDVALITRHDLCGTRTLVADDISKFVEIAYAGAWRNNTSDLYTKYNNNKFAFLTQFKFNICPENMIVDAYVTEKIFDAFQSDCIPLYAGGGNYMEPEVINPKAIVRWDADKKFGCKPDLLEKAHLGRFTHYPITWVADDDRNSDSIELFKNLLTDKKTYDEFKDQDRILPSGVKYVIKMFEDLEKHFERLIYG